MLQKLEGLYVIYFDKQTRKYVIPEKLQEALSLYVPTNLHETLDNFYRFMHGLLMTRGFMSIKEAEKIYLNLKPDGMTIDFMKLLNLSSRIKIEVDPFAYEIDNELILLNCVQRYDNEHYQPVYAYTWSMYQGISTYGVNLELECMQKLYNLLVKKSTPHHFKNLLEMLVESIQSGKTYLGDLFIHKIYEATNDFEYSKKLFNEGIYALPNWAFKGDPLMMVDDHVTDEKSFEGDFDMDDEVTYDLCPCGSGKTVDLCCLDESSNVESFVNLSIDDADAFYQILQELMYLYDKSKLPKTYQTVLRYIERLDQTAYIDLKDRVIGNLDIIQSYLDIKGSKLDQVALDLLNGFKQPIKGHYVALGYQDK